MKTEVLRLDVTVGVSLLDRTEQEKLNSKLERVHPNIPNARMAPNSVVFTSANKHQQEGLHAPENMDPNRIIRENT